MNRDDYIKQCLTEHLLTRIYKKLPNITAMNMINLTKTALTNIFYTHKFQLSQAEITYFTRSFKLCHRIPIFYGMPKVYKNPMALRPVVRLTILNPILHQRLKGPSNRNKKDDTTPECEIIYSRCFGDVYKHRHKHWDYSLWELIPRLWQFNTKRFSKRLIHKSFKTCHGKQYLQIRRYFLVTNPRHSNGHTGRPSLLHLNFWLPQEHIFSKHVQTHVFYTISALSTIYLESGYMMNMRKAYQ